MLRKGQDELVNTYRGGYCGVPAIPGGGKTFALTEWVVEALTEGINKDGKILIVTYMGSAVNNFKQRISAKLEAKGINSKDYFVSTIHSLCMQIIKESPEKVMIDEEFSVIDQTTKNQIIKDCINNWKRKSTNSQLYMYFIDEMTLKNQGYDKIAQKWDKAFNSIMGTAISDFKINQITPKDKSWRCNFRATIIAL
jgi:DNA helicase-2/ATP-dependent DNA helicase PcrA